MEVLLKLSLDMTLNGYQFMMIMCLLEVSIFTIRVSPQGKDFVSDCLFILSFSNHLTFDLNIGSTLTLVEMALQVNCAGWFGNAVS